MSFQRKVIGVEHIPELVQTSVVNVKSDHPELLEKQPGGSPLIEFHVGDGRLGFAAGAPYDAIHVGASCDEIPRPVRFVYHDIS